ncbi:MAG: methanethiol S-methyltransferase [Phenylobacterium sp.]
MGKIIAVLYGMLSYLIFFGAFLYAIAFVDGLSVPKAIDSGAAGALVPSLVVDALLLGVFAVQHSVMARPAFKAWWTTIVPPQAERSTYVLLSSLALILICWQWRPIPAPALWTTSGNAATVLLALSGVGWMIVLTSTFLINHFDLFGLRQVWAYASGKETPPPEFRTPLFYRVVRHPLYVGFIIAFWAAPTMSLGHLVFAIATTGYILIAIQLEEHDLVGVFGDTYRSYQKRVAMILPWIPGSRT